MIYRNHQQSEAPLVHNGMSLEQRCELSLCGFLLQDLWSVLASRREVKEGLKKGSCQLAGQTRNNLQAIALTTVAICLSKPDTWNPFQHNVGMSEVAIERMFGRFRSSSQSGELHVRSYWSASAAVARCELTKLKKLTKKFGQREAVDSIPALSDAALPGYNHMSRSFIHITSLLLEVYFC